MLRPRTRGFRRNARNRLFDTRSRCRQKPRKILGATLAGEVHDHRHTMHRKPGACEVEMDPRAGHASKARDRQRTRRLFRRGLLASRGCQGDVGATSAVPKIAQAALPGRGAPGAFPCPLHNRVSVAVCRRRSRETVDEALSGGRNQDCASQRYCSEEIGTTESRPCLTSGESANNRFPLISARLRG